MQVSLRIFIIRIGRDNNSLERKADHKTIRFRLRAYSYLIKARLRPSVLQGLGQAEVSSELSVTFTGI